MSLIPWAWLAIAVLLWRPTARTTLNAFLDVDSPETVDVAMSGLLGGLVALLWPAWIVPVIVYRLLRGNLGPEAQPGDVAARLFGESRRDKILRLEEEAQARQAYIARLERENGL